MKLLNYDVRHLIMGNLRKPVVNQPDRFTRSQYNLLCRIVIQRKIKKDFFNYLLSELYGLSDWRNMDYKQMYELIYILNHWDYKKGEPEHE